MSTGQKYRTENEKTKPESNTKESFVICYIASPNWEYKIIGRAKEKRSKRIKE